MRDLNEGDSSPRLVPCALCGAALDPLRAPRVRFSATQQWFFCKPEHANQFNIPREVSSPTLPHASAKLGKVPTPSVPPPSVPPPSVRAKQVHVPLNQPGPPPAPALLDINTPRSEPSKSITTSPVGQPLLWAPTGLAFVATGLAFANDEEPWALAANCLLLLLSTGGGQSLIQKWNSALNLESAQIERRMTGTTLRSSTEGPQLVSETQLRPGEEVIVRAGEYILADGTITSGEGYVQLWQGQEHAIAIAEGDRVVAGAKVEKGTLRVVCSKTGPDRAFSSLVAPLGERIDNKTFASRWARHLSLHLAPLVAAATLALVWLQGGSYALLLGVFSAVWGALFQPISLQLPGLFSRRSLLWAGQKGITFSHERLVDQAGAVTAAVFCARGTVLYGEPEVSEIHPLRDTSTEEILALAAGSESVVHHPVASAILRAAESRDIRANGCRSHNEATGMGVVCLSAEGETIVFGSRELLLRERVSIAMAEGTLRGLESRGLTALMLAKNNHLIGVLALQDTLRSGSKAAIQLLIDQHIEPVLLSGDSRATTEAVGHALAIEHIRPEISAPLRGGEVTSLIDSGATVAVVGTSPRDDVALGACPVPIVLEGASIRWHDSKRDHDRGIGLAGKQVINAPLALMICRCIRINGLVHLSLSYLPVGLGIMATASRLAPLYLPALLAMLSAGITARLYLWKERDHETGRPLS